MINVRVLEAKNLPILNDHLRKTIVSCFSYSSYRYYYGSYKSKGKSTNPKLDFDFNVDLFKLIQLRFDIYGYRSMNDDFYIGYTTINFNQFISESPGDQILNNPGSSIQKEFPIISTFTKDSKLTLIFTYLPNIYHPIKFKPSYDTNSILHIWATFSPNQDHANNPAEIELLQAIPIPDDKNIDRIGYFYNLSKENSWESVGRSSLDRYFLGPTGPTQVHSLSLPKLDGKYTFFILDVADFSGKISLNFAYENSGDFAHFADKCFIKTKKNNQSIGIIKTIDVDVEPNKKYLVPYYFFIEMNSMKMTEYEFNRFLSEKDEITFDKSKILKNICLDYTDRLSLESEFHSKIIKKAQTIPNLEKINFLRTNILPLYKSVSLSKLLCDYKLKDASNIRFYVGGSTTNTAGMAAYVDPWKQNFIAYDKTHGQINSEISMMIEDQLKSDYQDMKLISKLPGKVNWNSIISLNLNQIDKDTVLTYYVYCNSYLLNAFPSGFFLISQYEDKKETLLFRNTIFADSWKSHYAICCRLEYIDDEWKIYPMRKYFETEKLMAEGLDLNLTTDSHSSDDGLAEEIQLEDIF